MTVTPPTDLSFLYSIAAASRTYRYTNDAEAQMYDGNSYDFIAIEHTAPKFSGEPQESEVDITMSERAGLANVFILGPPPYPVIVTIYEYDRETATASPYYVGWITRSPFRLGNSLMSIHLKTLWHFFDREAISDSLAALSRYSIYDDRSGCDTAGLVQTIAVTALNDSRDVLTVTGISDPDGWFTGGIIIAPDQDMRTIVEHVGGQLTLSAAFPPFTLDVGFSADVLPGDDLTYETWANKFAAITNDGERHGGWPYMPNVDPAVRGVS